MKTQGPVALYMGVALSWKSCRLWARSLKIHVLPVLLSSCVPSIALFSRFPFVVVYRAGCLLVNKQTNCSRCIWVVQECGWPVAVYSIGCIGHFGVSNLEIALTQAAQHSQQREPEINQLGNSPGRYSPVFKHGIGKSTINGGLQLEKIIHKWGLSNCYVWFLDGIISIFFLHHFFGIGGPEGANFVASWANIGGFPIIG